MAANDTYITRETIDGNECLCIYVDGVLVYYEDAT